MSKMWTDEHKTWRTQWQKAFRPLRWQAPSAGSRLWFAFHWNAPVLVWWLDQIWYLVDMIRNLLTFLLQESKPFSQIVIWLSQSMIIVFRLINYYRKITHSDIQQQFYLAVVKNTADCECEDGILSPLLLLCKRITIMPLPTSNLLGHFLLIIDIHSLSLKGFT